MTLSCDIKGCAFEIEVVALARVGKSKGRKIHILQPTIVLSTLEICSPSQQVNLIIRTITAGVALKEDGPGTIRLRNFQGNGIPLALADI